MGIGRNALHLARAGWDVTGFDVSSVGVRHAEATARTEKLRLRAVVAADEEFDFRTSQWDLIALIYAIEKRNIHRARQALRPCWSSTQGSLPTPRPRSGMHQVSCC